MVKHAPTIVVNSLEARRHGPGKYGNFWQYHSRSDYHSKVSCWALLFDLLNTCPKIKSHVVDGRLCFGINHKMVDFERRREKALDLVLCSPRSDAETRMGGNLRTWKGMIEEYNIVLNQDQTELLSELPDLPETPVGNVYLAVEAKACMTAHGKARPRLYDELNSSHLTIHGNVENAIAVALVMINNSDEFISPDNNRFDMERYPVNVNSHKQPHDTTRVVEKIGELPRRADTQSSGFDAIGITVVRMRNDFGPVDVVNDSPSPAPGDVLNYDGMVDRICQRYTSRFPQI